MIGYGVLPTPLFLPSGNRVRYVDEFRYGEIGIDRRRFRKPVQELVLHVEQLQRGERRDVKAFRRDTVQLPVL